MSPNSRGTRDSFMGSRETAFFEPDRRRFGRSISQAYARNEYSTRGAYRDAIQFHHGVIKLFAPLVKTRLNRHDVSGVSHKRRSLRHLKKPPASRIKLSGASKNVKIRKKDSFEG